MTSAPRPRPRVIAHVDMDAFFVSVERVDRPELRQRPMLVAFDSDRSVVLSATYDLRRLGVHSAQPLAQAKRLAPHALIVSPRHWRYSEASEKIMAILAEISPELEQVSVDEAFLDLSGTMRRYGTPERAAAHIRERIRSELGLPASVGLAPNKFLAKMASGRAKPDGVFSVPPGRVAAFMEHLPVDDLFGVGAATARALHQAGFATAGDLARADPQQAQRLLGSAAARLQALARGLDDRPIVTERDEKSISAEHTFGTDVTDREQLLRTVLWLSHRVAARARSHERVGEGVGLKVRWEDFTTQTRQRRVSRPTDSAREIGEAARSLLDGLPGPLRPVRLIGVKLDSLAPAGSGLQLSLEHASNAQRDAEAAMDRINERFSGSLGPASLLGPDSIRAKYERRRRGTDAGSEEPLDAPPE